MDWLIHNHGQREALSSSKQRSLSKPYRLYRFLTELEDILETVQDDQDRRHTPTPSQLHSLSAPR